MSRDPDADSNRLAHEALGRTLDDLPPQTRKLLLILDDMVKQACGAQKIERAEHRTMPRTGHMGLLTQPSVFADVVSGFAHAHHH